MSKKSCRMLAIAVACAVVVSRAQCADEQKRESGVGVSLASTGWASAPNEPLPDWLKQADAYEPAATKKTWREWLHGIGQRPDTDAPRDRWSWENLLAELLSDLPQVATAAAREQPLPLARPMPVVTESQPGDLTAVSSAAMPARLSEGQAAASSAQELVKVLRTTGAAETASTREAASAASFALTYSEPRMAGVQAPASDLTINASNSPYVISSGTFSYGNIRIGYNPPMFTPSNGELDVTGGTVNLSGGVYVGALDGTGIYSQSGGTLTTADFLVGNQNNGTATISTGILQTGVLDLGAGSGASLFQTGGTVTVTSTVFLGDGGAATYELDAGTLQAKLIYPSGGTLNFNGGTLQALASDDPSSASTTFFRSGGTVNIRNGGAIIDTNSYNVTIAQVLQHSSAGGDNAIDGGLTKNGLGTLTLTQVETYNGGTTVNAGTLQLGGGAGLTRSGSSGTGLTTVTVNNAASLTLSANSSITGGLAGDGGSGFTGGVGVNFSSSGTLTNGGTIQGGSGGSGAPGSGIGEGAQGGTGGVGVTLSGGGSLLNQGMIFGGDGPSPGQTPSSGGSGGAGALVSSGSLLTNTGTIRGGNPAAGVGGGFGGSGGAGVLVNNGGSLINSGTITGTNGASGTIAGNGGSGVVVTNGGSVTNSSSIIGGVAATGGANSPSDGIGVSFSGAAGTLWNKKNGTITRGVVMDNYANQVTLEIGSSITGGLNIGTSSLATLTLSDDGNGGTQLYSNAVGGTTALSGALIKAGIGTWTVDQSFTLAGGTSVNAGTLIMGDGTHAVALAGADGSSSGPGTPGTAGSTALTLNNTAIFQVSANATVRGGTGGSSSNSQSSGAGGGGVVVNAAGTLINAGTITGGAGGNVLTNSGDGGSPGVAVLFGASGGSFNNSGTITGGAGGTVQNGNGASGATGVVFATGGVAFANTGTISGGDGGNSTESELGSGGTGVEFMQVGTWTNNGTVRGGAGAGGTGTASFLGDGGAAIVIDAGGSLTNAGTVTGGNGGTPTQPFSDAGSGGAGVRFTNSGTLINSATITGGNGGNSGGPRAAGNGGAGVSFGAGGSVTNSGTIKGGAAGTSGTGGMAGAGVSISGGIGTLWNKKNGSIQGGVSLGNFANNVKLEIGSSITGGLNVGNSASSILTLSDDGSGGTQTYTAAVAGGTSFAGSLFKEGSGAWNVDIALANIAGATVDAGTLTLSGSDDNVSLGVTVNGGTLILAKTSSTSPVVSAIGGPGLQINGGTAQLAGTGGNQIWDGAGVTMTGGTFDLNGRSEAISFLSGSAGTVTNSAASTTSTLSVGSGSFGGTLADGSGTTALVKNGAGTLSLTADNSFSGGTTVNAGTLEVSRVSPGSTALGTGTVTINAGATLVGANNDAFGYAPNPAPASIAINGGTVTDLGTSSYRITLPNVTFTGGTLASANGNNGDGTGNYSFYGNGTSANVTTNASSNTATISAASVSLEVPTTFNVSSGTTSSKVDLLVSSNIIDAFGSNSLTKLGSGTMSLTGTNTYNGATLINAGTLLVNGSNNGSGSVTVGSNATLGGSGTIAGAVIVNNSGTLSPGNSPGVLHLGSSLTMNTGSTLNIELGGSTVGSYDQVTVAGALTLTAPTLVVTLVNSFTPAVLTPFYIIDRTGSDVVPSGAFASGAIVSDNMGNIYSINYAAYDPADGDNLFNDVSLTLITPVPEPSTWAAAALTLAIMVAHAFRVRGRTDRLLSEEARLRVSLLAGIRSLLHN